MIIISTEDIEQGQIAAQDIHSDSGNVLVLKGTTLSSALGRRLKNWGISHIYIEGDDEYAPQSGEYTVSDDKIKDDLGEKFCGTLNNKHMKKIFEAVCIHREKHIGGV
ncbi:MAG: hypothetical protein FWE57_01375 [Chitinispirillia bacterium]|nr:hypothetical protein [Chitinispirillia bacterium]